MSKIYSIIEDSIINNVMLKGLSKYKIVPAPIMESGDVDETVRTGYSVISSSEGFNDQLKGCRKYTKTELDTAIATIRSTGYIRNRNQIVNKNSAFPDAEGRRARFIGAFNITVASGATGTAEYEITEERWMTGGSWKVTTPNFGDHIKFEILDAEDNVLDICFDNWYVSNDLTLIETYCAKLPVGVKLKLTYTNTGSDSLVSKILVNLLLHKG